MMVFFWGFSLCNSEILHVSEEYEYVEPLNNPEILKETII
jgi:hypothetical protein